MSVQEFPCSACNRVFACDVTRTSRGVQPGPHCAYIWHPGLASYPGHPMLFNVAHEKSGRPGRLCDVMMMCGHHLGHGLKISAQSPTQTFTRYTQRASQKRAVELPKEIASRELLTMEAAWDRLTPENSLEVGCSSLSESMALNLTRSAALLQY